MSKYAGVRIRAASPPAPSSNYLLACRHFIASGEASSHALRVQRRSLGADLPRLFLIKPRRVSSALLAHSEMLQPRDDDADDSAAAAAAAPALGSKAFHLLQHYVPILRWLPSYDVRFSLAGAQCAPAAWRGPLDVALPPARAAVPPAPVAQTLAGRPARRLDCDGRGGARGGVVRGHCRPAAGAGPVHGCVAARRRARAERARRAHATRFPAPRAAPQALPRRWRTRWRARRRS